MNPARKHRIVLTLLLFIFLPMILAAAGWFAAPAVSRLDYAVRLTERLYQEDTGRVEGTTLETDAWRASGSPNVLIVDRARDMRRKYRIGTTIFGVWCGLVLACSLARSWFPRRLTEYQPDPAECVACAQCFASCPVEQDRLREKALCPTSSADTTPDRNTP